MEFLVLGPPEVRSDGTTVPLGGRRREVLLARMLVDANRIVTSERLIEDLWNGNPPGTALTATYRRCVGHWAPIESKVTGRAIDSESDRTNWIRRASKPVSRRAGRRCVRAKPFVRSAY